jgi:N utilization substance protein A
VAKALSPARVREVLVDDDAKQATVIVPDDQLSLAIGKDGLNARLAARLTGWRVDIRSETEFAEEEAEMGYEEDEAGSGRCAAILANGRRCPNAALSGSRYCGLPAHQELEATDSDYVVPPDEAQPAAEEAVAPEATAPEEPAEPAAEEAAPEPVAAGAEPTGSEPEEASSAEDAGSADGGSEPLPETTAENELREDAG